MAADFRQFFSVSLFDESVNDREFILLCEALLKMSESRIHTKLTESKYAFSMTDVVLYSIYDLLLMANVDPKKKNQVKLYDKPWEKEKALKTKKSKMTLEKFEKLKKNRPTKFSE